MFKWRTLKQFQKDIVNVKHRAQARYVGGLHNNTYHTGTLLTRDQHFGCCWVKLTKGNVILSYYDSYGFFKNPLNEKRLHESQISHVRMIDIPDPPNHTSQSFGTL